MKDIFNNGQPFEENDEFKIFDSDDIFNSDDENTDLFSNDSSNNLPDDFIPISDETEKELLDNESNVIFFFGVSAAGKSVILSSILYFLNSRAGVLSPNNLSPNSKEAKNLLADFFENISKGILPNRTTRDRVTRIDLNFKPNNKSKKTPSINLTFLETAGGNHADINRGNQYHSSIDRYLNENIPLNIIIVTSYNSAHKEDALIDTFLNRLVEKGIHPENVKILLVISKWDLSGKTNVATDEELATFIQQRLPMTNSKIDTHDFAKTFFTIGKIEQQGNHEKITNLNLYSAGIIANWIYESITRYPINYPGTLLERIRSSFSL
jgi:hypothetical protein